jgi:hypothetical protein
VQSAPAERDAARGLQFQSRGTVPREIETLRRNAMRTNHLLATAGLAAMLGLGLVACKEETKVYNSGRGDADSDTRHVDHRTTTETTKVKG